jgi:diguanylate cyclase (GGDEF)-like protein
MTEERPVSVPDGYTISEVVHQGTLTLICRAHRQEDARPVVLKILRNEFPGQGEIARLRLEYDTTRLFDDEHVVKAIGYEEQGKSTALVLEDFGGNSLDRVAADERLDPMSCLQIALKVLLGLEVLHGRGMVHKDINPSNIVWNRQTNQVKLIDLGFASVPPVARAVRFDTDVVEGTLTYISPEQTGRINRQLDYRSDLYSLGATLYEMVTGQPPFTTDDPLELVHAHIAKMPVPPQELNPDIPAAFSAVIMKLLAKVAEERYQSTYGLREDLEACLQQVQSGNIQALFVAGKHDVSSTFTVSQTLYGREKETGVLLDVFERVSRGGGELVMIGGYSGVGKTTLVNELQKPLVEKHGYFAMGKFDPLNRSIPYHAFIQAFKELVRQLLAESESQIQRWRQRLLEALGPNGQVVVSVIPEVAYIIGPQPVVQSLPAQESQNRFNRVLQRFVDVFSSAEHPLTLFLDDLQWADSASLRLLERLMGDGSSRYLLIVGTFRDNEVDAAHPLSLTLEQIRKSPATLSEITLQPLALSHVTAIIADSLQTDGHQVAELARICMDKTSGNPFFLIQLLHDLHDKGFIRFDRDLGQWRWETERIAGAEIADSVAALMVDKIGHLPGPALEALKLAAGIGERFDLKTLAIVHERPNNECAEALSPAVRSGLIYPMSEDRLSDEVSDNQDLSYRFLHDRVHQAAYSLIDESRKPVVHLRIGRLLMQRLDPERRDEQIFSLVNHLNLGIGLTTDPHERMQLARLNLQAGQKAKRAAANNAAFGYFSQGIALLPEAAWSQTHELALPLHEEAAEAAYLCQRYEEMDRLIEQVLANAHDNLQKAKVYGIRILAHTARNNLREGVASGLAFLDSLEVRFPQPIEPQAIGDGLAHIRSIIGERSIESLSQLPEMTDPRALVVMDTLTTLASPAYNYSPELFTLLVLKQVELSLNLGNAADSAFAYSVYALILCAAEGRYDDGDAFGRLAIDLMERLKAHHFKTKIYLDVYLFVHHWKHPLRETLKPLLEAYRSGLEQGDLLFTALSAHVYCHHTLFSARYLPETDQEFSIYRKAIARLDQQAVLHWTEIFHQTVLNLMNGNGDPLMLEGEAFSETEMAHLCQEENDKTICFLYGFNKLILCYLFGAYDQALTHAEKAENYLHSVMGIIHVPLYRFYASLTRLALAESAGDEQRRTLLAAVDAALNEFKSWAESAPMNYAHKYLLMEAERWRVLAQPEKAEACYDEAIGLAAENGFIHDEALANELAGRYYLDKGRRKIARLYLRDALRAYSRWGAEAKVAALQDNYGEPLLTMSRQTTSTEAVRHSSETPIHKLDLASVLKVSQTIAEEIVLERLLDKVMISVMENAGAQRGFLISVDEQGRLGVVVEAESTSRTRRIFEPDSLEARSDLCTAVVYYVARTGERLVLNDAVNEGMFTADAYVLERNPKSILCMPLSHRGRLSTILYLENNLISDAFTPEHLELLNLLSSQMAVSIENAKLYVGLEARVDERTEQLNDKVGELSNAYESLKRTQSELEIANAKLEGDKELLQELSSTDRLTKLYNRAKFEELFEYEIRQTLRYDTPLSLIMVDLDHFKQVNDTYGHQVGDLVLQDMATILTRSSRASDAVARWGGEEFLILAPKTNLEQAAQLAEKIRIAVEKHPFAEVGSKTGSFGVACYRQQDTLTSLLQRADTALYRAKEEGRNRVVAEDGAP